MQVEDFELIWSPSRRWAPSFKNIQIGIQKKTLFPVFNLSRKIEQKQETTLLPFLLSMKNNKNKICNKVIIYALIHLPSTKVHKKKKGFNLIYYTSSRE